MVVTANFSYIQGLMQAPTTSTVPRDDGHNNDFTAVHRPVRVFVIPRGLVVLDSFVVDDNFKGLPEPIHLRHCSAICVIKTKLATFINTPICPQWSYYYCFIFNSIFDTADEKIVFYSPTTVTTHFFNKKKVHSRAANKYIVSFGGHGSH